MGRCHLRCVKLLEGADVVAIADTLADSLASAAEMLPAGIPQYEDYHDMLASEELDAVVVATPNDTHADIACDVIAAGVHMLLEKPLAASLAGCNRVRATAGRGPQVVQVGLELRCCELFRRLRKLIDAGTAGEVRQLWCKEFRGPFLRKVGDWIVQADRSGGALVEKDCHHFDLFHWMAGRRPERVAGFGSCDLVYGRETFDVEPTVLDNAQVIIEHEGGAVACLMLCMFAAGYDEGLELGVIGTEATVVATLGRKPDEKDLLRVYPRGKEPGHTIEMPQLEDAAIRASSHGGWVYYEHEAFRGSIRTGARPEADVEAAWWATAVGIAAERAIAERRIVEMSELTAGE